jgi:hypothetical protein
VRSNTGRSGLGRVCTVMIISPILLPASITIQNTEVGITGGDWPVLPRLSSLALLSDGS